MSKVMGVNYTRLLNSTLREEGKALVTQATDEQSQQTNAVTYIQVSYFLALTSRFLASNWQHYNFHNFHRA